MENAHLRDAVSKIKWADKNIKDLNAAIRRFRADGGPCRVVAEREADTGDVVFRVRNVLTIPDHLNNTAADAIGAMRAPLDYLANALVIAAGNTPPRKCGFPIFLDFEKYESMKNGMIEGVSVTAETRIQSLQPFNPGPGANHPLWQLHELDNTDKHRLCIPFAAITDSTLSIYKKGLGPLPANKWFGRLRYAGPQVAKDGAELLRFIAVAPDMHMEPKFVSEIVLPQVGDTPHQPVVPLLHQLLSVVKRILDDFCGEFI